MVCRLVVCLSVTLMSPAKTAELIEMLFELRTWVVPENDVFDGGPDPHGKGQFLGKGTPIARYLPWAVQKWLNRSICCLGGRLGWAKGSTSSIVFARWHQRALMGGHIGTTWWIQLNHPSASAMRPYVNLLWPLMFVTDVLAGWWKWRVQDYRSNWVKTYNKTSNRMVYRHLCQNVHIWGMYN